MIPNLLSISGSDPSGASGIQADIKSFHATGVYGMAVPTQIAVRNSTGFKGGLALDPQLIARQIRAILEDIRVDAIKVGMLCNAEIIHAVAEIIRPYIGPIIVDPVMATQSGHVLLDEAAIVTLRRELLPCADILTPNLPEAARLSEMQELAYDRADMENQGRALIARGAGSVLVKGGHGKGAVVTDILVEHSRFSVVEHCRIPTRNTRGAGCALSAVLASARAKDQGRQTAFIAASDYVNMAIMNAHRLSVGHGRGAIMHPMPLAEQGNGSFVSA